MSDEAGPWQRNLIVCLFGSFTTTVVVAMSLMEMASSVHELVALRLLAGLLGGYASGSTVLVATQTPNRRSGWALGVLSSGVMAGSLAGPLVGRAMPLLIGIRVTFLAAEAAIFVAFLATALLMRETPLRRPICGRKWPVGWVAIPDQRPIVALPVTGLLLMLANMSTEPIITAYVAQFVAAGQVTFVAGLVMAAAALGSILSASRLGKLADRIGNRTVIITCLGLSALLPRPQAFVTAAWQLVVLRFLIGLSLGGLLPCIPSVICHNVPESIAGTVLGYWVSSRYAGQVAGPVLGGLVGGHVGMRAVFLGTVVLLTAGAFGNRLVQKGRQVGRGRTASQPAA